MQWWILGGVRGCKCNPTAFGGYWCIFSRYSVQHMHSWAWAWVWQPKIFGYASRASGWTPISKFLNPPLKWLTIISLTPADKWDDKNEFGSGLMEHNDQLLEHEHSFCTHPHHSNQRKVVDQCWGCHTASIHICLVNTSNKNNQHAKQSYAELDVELCSVTFTKFPVEMEMFTLVKLKGPRVALFPGPSSA